MANISIVPFVRASRAKVPSNSRISIKVYIGNKIAHSETLNHKIDSAYWDTEKHLVKTAAVNSSMLNSLIKKRVAELEAQFLESELMGFKVTKARIKKACKGEKSTKDYIAFCNETIPVKYPLKKQEGTRRQHYSELTKLQCFRKYVSFADIDYKFLSEYKAWMIRERNNQANTVWKSFKAMHAMLNEAIRIGGYINENPFKEFNRGRYKQGNRKFLEISDCDKIHALLQTDIPERLRLVGIYYLFMCYTGFRFQDAINFFNYETHVIDNERIVIETQKADEFVNIKIHKRLREVLEGIKNHPLKISNKDFNSYTKVLATMAKIDIAFTAHTGRHTFGAILAQLDVPIERAQKLLGHRDIESTKIYYHIKNKSLDGEMDKFDSL
jgi:site-specific recombinase XerD